jgi:hypothetical protein
MNYQTFLSSKAVKVKPSGFTPDALCPDLFEFQGDIDRWALERGRAAIFADCGLLKNTTCGLFAERGISSLLGYANSETTYKLDLRGVWSGLSTARMSDSPKRHAVLFACLSWGV